MFEFLESKADELIERIKDTADDMASDSNAASSQADHDDSRATKKEKEAKKKESEAIIEEGKCPHYKPETYTETVTNEDGTTYYESKTRSVPDPEEDARSRALASSLRAKASSLRAEAAALKAAAEALRALANSLRAQMEAMKAQRENFGKAIEQINGKARETANMLNEGTGLIVRVISSFSIPKINGVINMTKNTANSLLKNVGIDLSDGFDKNDVYGLTGWIAQTTVSTGAVVAKTFDSSTVASILGGDTLGAVIDKAFGEEAVDGVHKFLISALEFIGIKAKPYEKETAEVATEDVNAILAGDKKNISAGTNSSMSNRSASSNGPSGKRNVGMNGSASSSTRTNSSMSSRSTSSNSSSGTRSVGMNGSTNGRSTGTNSSMSSRSTGSNSSSGTRSVGMNGFTNGRSTGTNSSMSSRSTGSNSSSGTVNVGTNSSVSSRRTGSNSAY